MQTGIGIGPRLPTSILVAKDLNRQYGPSLQQKSIARASSTRGEDHTNYPRVSVRHEGSPELIQRVKQAAQKRRRREELNDGTDTELL